jgi:dihydroorotate dehydrogenase (NAD+) catalytic subunit
MAIHTSFFDPELTYQENYIEGPFGAFGEGFTYQQTGQPNHDFFGHKVYLPFGIPAGPLVNGKYVKAAFRAGFDLPTYKTVRTGNHPCHPHPNIVPVKVEGDLTLEKAQAGLIQDDGYNEPISITNSFGVPSFDPDVWQADMQKAAESAGKGQVMIGSFQGTNKGTGVDKFIEDHVLGAKLVKETGTKIIEANFSCPNEGTANMLCFDTDRVLEISSRIKEEIGNTPLLIKLAYFKDQEHLEDYVNKIGRIVDGFSIINTIAAPVKNRQQEQALPGEGRAVSGICGRPIKWAGIDMVSRLNKLRDELNLNYKIVGCGGVTNPEDYQDYIQSGANAVTSATGAMWNPYLAKEIKES